MLSKLNLKIYKGKLIGFNPNLNRGTFPTEEQVNQIFHDHKNALSQVFRIEIEDPKTFTQITFVMKHSKAYGIASDYDAKALHCGVMVQIQGYYNPDNDLHTAIGMQIWTKNKPTIASEKNINQSEVALSHTRKASKANSKANSAMEKIVRQRASASIAKKFNKDSSSTASKPDYQSRATSTDTKNYDKNKYSNLKRNQQMLNKIDGSRQDSNQNNQNRKDNQISNNMSKVNRFRTSSQPSSTHNKGDGVNIKSSKVLKNQQGVQRSKDSVSNKSSKISLNSSTNSSSLDKQSTNPSNVIASAMRQVQQAGYNVQSFGDDTTDISTASQTMSSSANTRSVVQSSTSNNIQNNKSQNVHKALNSIASKSTNSESNKAVSNSTILKSSKNNQETKTQSGSNENKKSKQSNIAPSNFLPQHHSLSNVSTKNKASQTSTESKSSVITSIASKYQVPKSMAIIKYKIMQKSSISASKSNAKIQKMKSLKANDKESKALNTSSNKTSSTDKNQSNSLNQNHTTKLNHIKKQQKYYKQIDNREVSTLQQLKQLQKENKESKVADKDIPTTKEITKKVQKKQLPSMHLSKHGKQIQQAYQQVMNSKHMTTEQLDDKLRDIYRLEGWDSFFEQDTKTFLHQLKGDLNKILKGEDVRYPLSYNNIPNINEIEKLTNLQEKQDELNKKGDK